jgi:hypothetical protein
LFDWHVYNLQLGYVQSTNTIVTAI